MNFWPILKNDLKKEDFGLGRYILNTCDMQSVKDRHHTSFNLVKSSFYEIKLNEKIETNLDKVRYIIAKSISFDSILSLYDVNSSNIYVTRVYNSLDLKEIEKFYNKKRNIEIRIIGMQNGQKDYINKFLPLEKFGVLSEVDIFGNEIRHIAIDLKTGMTYNLLLENRIYRPGELLNQTKQEDFEKSIK